MSETTDRFHSDLVPKVKAARRVGTPIIAINTPDQPALVKLLQKALNGKTAMYAWDYVRGVCGLNDAGIKGLAALGFSEPPAVRDPIEAMDVARRLPKDGVVFYLQAQRFVQDAGVCQGLLNLRDKYKGDEQTIILLGTGITLPAEISSDVVSFTEHLPNDEQLLAIVGEIVSLADAEKQFKKTPTPAQVKQASVALRGCSAFGAEQLAAMSLREATGIDIETLHTQARAVIEQTPGLSFERGTESFADIKGLAFAKEFGTRLFKGPRAPAVVVRVEELEKSMAGAKGDLSGVSGDALQVLLTSMEDSNWSGMLAYGCPGAGKTLLAKAMANTFGAKAIRFDLNACRGSLVGQSEAMIRKAMQVIETLGGANVFFVASCNRLDNLPPELQRRFRCGVWYFDLPTKDERLEMWKLYRAKFKVPADEPAFDEDDLTGADIRNVCELSNVLACPLVEARKYIVPLKSQSPKDIENARVMAEGRFTCASKGGVYSRQAKAEAPSSRKVKVG